MDIKDLQKNWNELGKTDPLWAVISWKQKKCNRWNPEDFFAHGREEIERTMAYIHSLGRDVRRKRALDFGCGVGRLTQALARYFDEVYAVDIAPSMIDLAKRYNRHGNKCKYIVNDADDLKIFPPCSFDFIYSNITLQHMEPRYSARYLKELMRVLDPHGLLVFQLPSRPLKIQRVKQLILRLIPPLVPAYKKVRYRGGPFFEMYAIEQNKVGKILKDCGAVVLDTLRDDSSGKGWQSIWYYVAKE